MKGMRLGRVRLGFGYASFALASAFSVLGACNTEPGGGTSSESAAQSGRVHLALETGAAKVYRLDGASFEVRDRSGAVIANWGSSTDTGAGGVGGSSSGAEPSELELDLNPGKYWIELAAGWSLSVQGEDGSWQEVQGALISPNPREFQVDHQKVTELAYTFATDAGQVSFGRGSVELGLDVVGTSGLQSCNLLNPNSCASGQTCLLADDTGKTFCAQAGTLPLGSECSSEQCGVGAQCLRLPGEAKGVCKLFCDPSANPPACSCQSLSFDSAVGVCADIPSCEPNCAGGPQTFSFVDDNADNLVSGALYDFFRLLPAVNATDYILFEIGSTAWCASNANFYVQNYLSYAPSYGNSVFSGNWDKYYRPAGGFWSGPDTAAYVNNYSAYCGSAYSYDWCGEVGLGGQTLSLLPNSSGMETQVNGSWASSGSAVRIVIGASRRAACGF